VPMPLLKERNELVRKRDLARQQLLGVRNELEKLRLSKQRRSV
jgi:hypothetical protein